LNFPLTYYFRPHYCPGVLWVPGAFPRG